MAVAVERSDGEPLAAEGLWDFPHLSPEGDVTPSRGDGANDLSGIVLDLRNSFRHGARTWPVAIGGDPHAETFMRPFQIVEHAPAIEGVLDFRQSAERAQSKHFRVQLRWKRSFLPRPWGWRGLACTTLMPSLSSQTFSAVQRTPDVSPQGEPLSM